MDMWSDPSTKQVEPFPADDKRAELCDADPVNARILSLINDLGFTVLTKSRVSELHG